MESAAAVVHRIADAVPDVITKAVRAPGPGGVPVQRQTEQPGQLGGPTALLSRTLEQDAGHTRRRS